MSPHSGSLGPSIWAVSDGRAGNAAQVHAVVQALSETRRWMRIAHINGNKAHLAEPTVLTPRQPWTWLPSGAWPLPFLALPKEQRSLFKAPWPTLWIAAGRRSAPYTAKVRELSGGETFCVQILDPHMDAGAFDLISVPEHDRLTGPNVIKTVGSPSHFSEEAVEEAGQVFADLAESRNKSCIIILGGTSKTHSFPDSVAEKLIDQLKQLASSGWRLRITASRRTPSSVNAKVRAFADQVGAQFWAGAEDGPNPYIGWLLFSDVAIVTEDSANMLSDAAWHGLPIHIAKLKGESIKFGRLHQSLIDRGAARWFDGALQSWDYEPLREAERVADRIIEALLARHPQPSIEGQTSPPNWL